MNRVQFPEIPFSPKHNQQMKGQKKSMIRLNVSTPQIIKYNQKQSNS